MLAPFANLSTLPTDGRAWGSFVVMGVVYTGLVFVLLYGAIQKLPTHMAGALSFLYPVVAIVVDFVAFDHRLHPLQFLGVVAILLAAAGVHLGWSFKRSKAPAVD
jgi:drug/metabolite transporter (DMT)-like permease